MGCCRRRAFGQSRGDVRHTPGENPVACLEKVPRDRKVRGPALVSSGRYTTRFARGTHGTVGTQVFPGNFVQRSPSEGDRFHSGNGIDARRSSTPHQRRSGDGHRNGEREGESISGDGKANKPGKTPP